MSRPPKARVREAFSRAAVSYDEAAVVQRRICDRLAATLAVSGGRILDVGCGTGYALDLLQMRCPDARLVALDIAPAMLVRVPGSWVRVAGDAEHLPFADAAFTAYWSSLTLQWCDLGRALGEASRVLAPGGGVSVATLGPATFRELRHAFAGVDSHRHTLPFHTADEVAQLASTAGLLAVDVRNGRETAHYPDFRSLMKAVKAIGANQVGAGRRTGLLGRADLARAESAIEELREPSGLPLTYDVITLSAHR
ncbi:MAG: methyltransferase domain-containing protein [Betaproteobacteria bacterium]|nr:methyltransferase domain-containing protein [Betaproteobacteria bacterium]